MSTAPHLRSAYTPRGEALAQMAAGARLFAEGLDRLAALEDRESRRSAPDLLSVEQAMELWPGIGRKQIMDAARGKPWVRKPSPKKVLFERVGFCRWLTVRGAGR